MMSIQSIVRIAALTATLAAPLTAGPASRQTAPAPADTIELADDEFGRSSPRGAISGFLEACRQRDYERAGHYLDAGGDRADAEKRELARQLKAVLDHTLWVEPDAMSGAPSGDLDDGLAPELERVAGSPAAGQSPASYYLERDTTAEGRAIWRVSAATLARVPSQYESLAGVPLEDYAPAAMLELTLFEVNLWQWAALALLFAAAWIAAWIAAAAIVRLARPLVSRSATDLDDRLLQLALGPIRLVLAVGAVSLLLPHLALAVPAERFFVATTTVLAIAGVTWLVFRAIDLFAAMLRERLQARGQGSATYLVPIGSKTLKAAIGALVVLASLDTFGFDITAIVAGLGVGGLAVALALRPTLENVFGGVAVLVDEPVRPGQFCRFGDTLGTVEEVGLRSTRLRTPDRTLVTVPNADFSTGAIENFAARDRIRLLTTLGLRYETSPDQLRHVLAELRRILIAHPEVAADPRRVRFVGFGASSLDVEVLAYVQTSDYAEFLGVREDLYLRMMDAVDASGTGFAFPSTTAYLARDGGLDEEKTRAAEDAVAEWRRAGRLPFPDFDALALAINSAEICSVAGRKRAGSLGSGVPVSSRRRIGARAACSSDKSPELLSVNFHCWVALPIWAGSWLRSVTMKSIVKEILHRAPASLSRISTSDTAVSPKLRKDSSKLQASLSASGTGGRSKPRSCAYA